MTLHRFAKWWSLASLIVVVMAVVLTYVGANEDNHLPKHHPWPAISVGALAVVPLTVTGARKTSILVFKLVVSALAVTLAIVVNQIT